MKNKIFILIFLAINASMWGQGSTHNYLPTTLIWDVSNCEVSRDSIHKTNLIKDQIINDTIKVCSGEVMNYYVTGANLRNVKKINWHVVNGTIKDQYDNVALISWEDPGEDKMNIEIIFDDLSIAVHQIQVLSRVSNNNNQIAAFNSIQLNYDSAGNQVLRSLIYLAARTSQTDFAYEHLTTADMFAQSDQEDVLYYPNPVKQELSIRWIDNENHDMETIELYDLNGRLIKTIPNQNQVDTAIINFESLPVGLYTIQLIYTGGERKTLKIVKQE